MTYSAALKRLLVVLIFSLLVAHCGQDGHRVSSGGAPGMTGAQTNRASEGLPGVGERQASASRSQVAQLSPALHNGMASEGYLIGPEDVVEILVWKNPDLSRAVTVRPDGQISLPLLGDLQAVGLTTSQLAANITAKLMAYYKEPAQVSVIMQQVNSYAVYILGEVHKPSKYLMRTGTTFLQGITLAGGFTEFASTNKILVLRRENDHDHKEERIKVRGAQENILLKPRDVIIVP